MAKYSGGAVRSQVCGDLIFLLDNLEPKIECRRALVDVPECCMRVRLLSQGDGVKLRVWLRLALCSTGEDNGQVVRTSV